MFYSFNPIEMVFNIIKRKFKALRARKFMGLHSSSQDEMIRQSVESVKKKDVFKCVNHVNNILR